MKFDDKTNLAKQIKYHRKKLNLTQAELAEMVDLSVQHISRIESGCYIPSLKSFFALVSVLNIDLKTFGFGTQQVENPLKEKLIQKINESTDTELEFYDNVINFLCEALSKVKN